MLDSTIKIRLLKKGEGKLLRDIRLRALKDLPDSFGQKYDEVANQPLSFWEGKILEAEELDDRITLLAMQEGKAIGMLFCFIRSLSEKTSGLGGMWIDPVARKKGIGQALIYKALEWLKDRGMVRVTLGNTKGNQASDRFYKKLGFNYTGREEPLESNPSLTVMEMEKFI